MELDIEFLHRAIFHRIAHIRCKGLRRSSASLQPADLTVVIAAHPDTGGNPAREADEIAILVGAGRTGLAGDRATDLGGPARTRLDSRLEKVGDPARNMFGDKLGGPRALVLVEQISVGSGHLHDAIGLYRLPAGGDCGKGAGHVEQANFVRPQDHRRIGVDRRRDPEPPGHRCNLAEPHFVAQLRSDSVDRIGESGAQIRLADIAPVRIARGPSADRDLGIYDTVIGRVSRLQRGQIDEQFPARTRLAQRVGRAVVVGFDIVGAAHERENCTIAIQAYQRALRTVGCIARDCGGSSLLHSGIKRGPHLDRLECLGQEQVELRQGPIGEITHRVRACLLLEVDCGHVDPGLAGTDLALFAHETQHDAGPIDSRIDIRRRRIATGGLYKPCNDGRFANREIIRGVAEEFAAGTVDPVSTAPEIYLVEIQFEDLLFRKFPLERHREDTLAQFAVERPVRIEEHVAGKLLGNGRCTADPRTGTGHPLHDSPGKADRIDAGMRIEPLVLDRDHRILHHLGDLVVGKPPAVARPDLDQFGTVARPHDDGLGRLRGLQLVIARQ